LAARAYLGLATGGTRARSSDVRSTWFRGSGSSVQPARSSPPAATQMRSLVMAALQQSKLDTVSNFMPSSKFCTVQSFTHNGWKQPVQICAESRNATSRRMLEISKPTPLRFPAQMLPETGGQTKTKDKARSMRRAFASNRVVT